MALILIVDDDAEYSDSISRRLRFMGFDSFRVGGGMAALEYCRTGRPDLILIDWVLPGGFSTRATLEILSKAPRTRDIPIVVISGRRPEAEDERAALACGARQFFSKIEIGETPGVASSLERHIRALLPPEAGRTTTPGESSVATPARPSVPASDTPVASFEGEGDPFAMPVAPTILVIDDQPDMADLLGLLFKDAGYRVQWAGGGKSGLSRAMTEFPDLVILDLHMPEIDGSKICRALREKSAASSFYLPILILTGDGRRSRHVHCLNVGADDYLVKPPPNDILRARVNALLRRTRFPVDADGRLAVGRATLDCRSHRFRVGDAAEPVSLTRTEAGILFLLMSARGKAVDQRLIHRKVCRSSTIPRSRSSTIKSHISHIRAKLGRHADLIVPVDGEGAYRFDVDACRS